MKAGTTELMKFQRLQRRLGESKRMVVGLLELLWQATAKNASEGDIGRFTDEEIAILCDWDSDPSTLIDALIETRWLDRSDTHRLVVHDWEHHCPTYIKGGMARYGKAFANSPKEVPKELAKEVPKEPAKEPAKEAPIAPSYLSYPILSNSTEEEEVGTKPPQDSSTTNGDETWVVAFRTAAATSKPRSDYVTRIIASVKLGLTPWQAVPPITTRLSCRGKGQVRNPTGYMATMVREFETKYDPEILTRRMA